MAPDKMYDLICMNGLASAMATGAIRVLRQRCGYDGRKEIELPAAGKTLRCMRHAPVIPSDCRRRQSVRQLFNSPPPSSDGAAASSSTGRVFLSPDRVLHALRGPVAFEHGRDTEASIVIRMLIATDFS
jgi:hypothetical protein